MKQENILGCFVSAIEETIFEKWKHKGFICGWSSEHINFEIDGREYVVRLAEIKEGEHWSERSIWMTDKDAVKDIAIKEFAKKLQEEIYSARRSNIDAIRERQIKHKVNRFEDNFLSYMLC